MKAQDSYKSFGEFLTTFIEFTVTPPRVAAEVAALRRQYTGDEYYRRLDVLSDTLEDELASCSTRSIASPELRAEQPFVEYFVPADELDRVVKFLFGDAARDVPTMTRVRVRLAYQSLQDEFSYKFVNSVSQWEA